MEQFGFENQGTNLLDFLDLSDLREPGELSLIGPTETPIGDEIGNGNVDAQKHASLGQTRSPEIQSWDLKAEEFARVWLDQFPGVVPTHKQIASLAHCTSFTLETLECAFKQLLQHRSSSTRDEFSELDVFNSFSLLPASMSHNPNSMPSSRNQVLEEAARWMKKNSPKCCRQRKTLPAPREALGTYKCTVGCGRVFSRKDVWKKRECEQYPQEGWICYLQDGSSTQITDSNDYTSPHSKNAPRGHCNKKPMGRGRIFYRKEHLRKHFMTVHSGMQNAESLLDDCHFLVQSKFPTECSWCKYPFRDLNDRIEHIANHYENEAAISDKSPPLEGNDAIQIDEQRLDRINDWELAPARPLPPTPNKEKLPTEERGILASAMRNFSRWFLSPITQAVEGIRKSVLPPDDSIVSNPRKTMILLTFCRRVKAR